MRENFENLMTVFCQAWKLGDADSYIAGAAIDVNGAECALLYQEALGTDTVFLHVTYDFVLPRREAQVIAALLRQNHSRFDGNGPGYCIMPSTNRLCEVSRLTLSRLTVKTLGETLVRHAARLEMWRAREARWLARQGASTRNTDSSPEKFSESAATRTASP